MRALWAIVLIVVASAQAIAPALAQAPQDQDSRAIEFKPFPTANISEPQWAAYFARVQAAHGKSLQRFPDLHLVVFDDGAATYYAFTQPGHPAHPAWITQAGG